MNEFLSTVDWLSNSEEWGITGDSGEMSCLLILSLNERILNTLILILLSSCLSKMKKQE